MKNSRFQSALLVLATAALLLMIAGPIVTRAQNYIAVNIVGYTLTTDVCQNPTVPKSHLAVNIGSATTTQLVAPSSGKTISVCNFTASVVGTSPTLQFEGGTGSTCGTSTAALTGSFAPTTGSILKAEGAGVQFAGASGSGLCAVSGGTGPSIQGYMDYVQQ